MKVINYELRSGRWLISEVDSSTPLSSGELDAQVVTCNISHWSDERIRQFAQSPKEMQVFDLEQLEFTEFSKRFTFSGK